MLCVVPEGIYSAFEREKKIGKIHAALANGYSAQDAFSLCKEDPFIPAADLKLVEARNQDVSFESNSGSNGIHSAASSAEADEICSLIATVFGLSRSEREATTWESISMPLVGMAMIGTMGGLLIYASVAEDGGSGRPRAGKARALKSLVDSFGTSGMIALTCLLLSAIAAYAVYKVVVREKIVVYSQSQVSA